MADCWYLAAGLTKKECIAERNKMSPNLPLESSFGETGGPFRRLLKGIRSMTDPRLSGNGYMTTTKVGTWLGLLVAAAIALSFVFARKDWVNDKLTVLGIEQDKRTLAAITLADSQRADIRRTLETINTRLSRIEGKLGVEGQVK